MQSIFVWCLIACCNASSQKKLFERSSDSAFKPQKIVVPVLQLDTSSSSKDSDVSDGVSVKIRAYSAKGVDFSSAAKDVEPLRDRSCIVDTKNGQRVLGFAGAKDDSAFADCLSPGKNYASVPTLILSRALPEAKFSGKVSHSSTNVGEWSYESFPRLPDEVSMNSAHPPAAPYKSQTRNIPGKDSKF